MLWSEEEFKEVNLGDVRLNNRLVQVAGRLSEDSKASIPSACKGWHETKATYRFFGSARVNHTKILSAHFSATKERIKNQDRVFLLQDTSELDYSKHFQKGGVGYLNRIGRKGLLIHPLLSISEDRLPLGLVDISWITRKTLGQKKRREKRPIEDKETFRWLEHYRKGNELAKEFPKTHFVVIGDRESDIYELLSEASDAKGNKEPTADLLVRSSHDRVVKTSKGKEGKIRNIASRAPVLGKIQFKLQSRQGAKSRIVTQNIRSTKVIVQPSQRRGDRGEMEDFEITVIHAKELHPPKGSSAVEWFLLSTAEVGEDFNEACKIIKWYLTRWDIELYFKALKSGCKVESIQLEEAQRFTSCLSLYMVIAWRILFLTRIARTNPNISCKEFLSTHEWRAAYIMIKKRKPTRPPTIGEAIRIIAQVGGYLARKSDGPPGMKTLWIGFARIHQVEQYNEIISNICG